MTDVKSPESQQELFSQFSQEPRRVQRFPSLAKSHKPILLSVTLEQILLSGIVLVLLFCLVFFLGILRGRSVRSVTTAPVLVSQAKVVSVPVTAPSVSDQPGQALSAPLPVARPVVTTSRPRLMIEDPAKPYSIQLVTYKKREHAEREVGALKRLGYFSTIVQRGDYYEVRAGQYGSAEEAKRDLAYFSTKYKGCFLCRR